MLLDKIFEEIFGDVDFGSIKFPQEEEDEKDTTYYHEVHDKYEDGKHVYHKEKEVKNGEVLKDVENNLNLEDKSKKIEVKDDEKKEEAKKCEKTDKCGDNPCIEFYEAKLRQATDLLEEARDTIKKQQEMYDKLESDFKDYIEEKKFYEIEYKKLNEKFNALKNIFK